MRVMLFSLMMFVFAVTPTYAISCEVDYYSTRSDGGIGFDGSVNFVICPMSCPENTSVSNVNGAWQCVGTAGFTGIYQTDCGSGLPCGPIPWAMPDFSSPTPIGSLFASVSDATATPAPTATPTFDLPIQDIADAISTANAMSYILVIEGTEQAIPDMIASLGNDAEILFGYVKGVQQSSFGPFTPIVNILFVAFVVIVATTLFRLIFPFIAMLFGIIRRVITFILDFLPF